MTSITGSGRRSEMSDQVIFTKEEVEKIRDVILSLKSELFLKVSNVHGPKCAYNYPEVAYARDGIALLDSQRPRPKVAMPILYALANIKRDLEMEDSLDLLDERIELTVSRFGFDVED
jgi:hypothetical protein